jgi:hypothetical protein
MEMPLSSQNAISLPSPRCRPATRPRAKCLPSGSRRREHPGAVVDDVHEAGRLKRCASSFSASAMPTALARPWPSGPVVVSTPGVSWPNSGWPGGLRMQLAEALELVDRQVVAAQVQQRVDAASSRGRWTARSGRGRPSSGSRVVLEEVVPQHFGDVGHAHRHARMAGVGRLDRVHGEEADGVGEIAAGRCPLVPTQALDIAKYLQHRPSHPLRCIIATMAGEFRIFPRRCSRRNAWPAAPAHQRNPGRPRGISSRRCGGKALRRSSPSRPNRLRSGHNGLVPCHRPC